MDIIKRINNSFLPLSIIFLFFIIYSYSSANALESHIQRNLLHLALDIELIFMAFMLINIQKIWQHIDYKKTFFIVISFLFICSLIVFFGSEVLPFTRKFKSNLNHYIIYANFVIFLPIIFSKYNRKMMSEMVFYQKNSGVHTTIFISIAVLCFAIFLFFFFPGVYDASDPKRYWKAANGILPIYSWHAPFLQYFWRFSGLFSGLFLYNLICYWVGLSLTAYALFNNLYARILVLLFVGFFIGNLQYIVLMRSDSIILSSIILSLSLIFTYIFRVKNKYLLWAALLFSFISIGLKQDIIFFWLYPLIIISYLLLKHYVRIEKIPFLKYKKKTHRVFAFLFLATTLVSGTGYINAQYESDSHVLWKSLISWSFMGTSVYSKKDLYTPNLIKPEYQGKISSSQLYDYVKKEYYPFACKNVWKAHNVNLYVKDFGTLSTDEKIYVFNQILSNPIAYLWQRFTVAKYMLNSNPDTYSPRLLFSLKNGWSEYNVTPNNSHTAVSLQNLFYAMASNTPKVIVYYIILAVLFLWTITRTAPFNTFHNALECKMIFCLSFASLFLFLMLIFIAPASHFRYHLLGLYSSEIALVLFFRAIYNYGCLNSTWIKSAIAAKQSVKFILPRIKLLIIFPLGIFSVVAITKHHKNTLFNHFAPIISNNSKISPQVFAEAYKYTQTATPIYSGSYKIYLSQQTIIYKRKPIVQNIIIYKKIHCKPDTVSSHFVLQVKPEHRLDLYLGSIFYGYDDLSFNFKRMGNILKDDDQTCLAVSFLPDYKISSINTSEIRHRRLWTAHLKWQNQSIKPFS